MWAASSEYTRPSGPDRGPRGGLDLLRQRLLVVDADVAAAVDEERRRAGHAGRVGAANVLGDAGRVAAPAQVLREAFEVEAEVGGVAVEVRGRELVLVGQQAVVELP